VVGGGTIPVAGKLLLDVRLHYAMSDAPDSVGCLGYDDVNFLVVDLGGVGVDALLGQAFAAPPVALGEPASVLNTLLFATPPGAFRWVGGAGHALDAARLCATAAAACAMMPPSPPPPEAAPQPPPEPDPEPARGRRVRWAEPLAAARELERRTVHWAPRTALASRGAVAGALLTLALVAAAAAAAASLPVAPAARKDVVAYWPEVTAGPEALELHVGDLPHAPAEAVQAALRSAPGLFAARPPPLGSLTMPPFDIPIPADAMPPEVTRAIPVPPARRAVALQALQELSGAGQGCWVPDSEPAYCSSFVVEQKGKLRMVNNCVAVNAVTPPNPLSGTVLPTSMLGPVAAMKGCTVFSSADCTKGFWSVPLTDRASRLLTMTTTWGKFRQLSGCFGPRDLPEHFHKALYEHALAPAVNGRFYTEASPTAFAGEDFSDLVALVHWVDDFVFGGRVHSDEDAARWARFHAQLAGRLTASGNRLSPSKSRFNTSEGFFVGTIFDGTTVRVDPERVQDLRDTPLPDDRKQLQAGIGLFGYYRWAVSPTLFADAIGRLNAINTAQWCRDAFSDAHVVAWRTLANAIADAAPLALPDWRRKVWLQTDAASEYGWGCTLYQHDDEGRPRPIAYKSGGWTASERGWHASTKEAAALHRGLTCMAPRYAPHCRIHVLVDAKNLLGAGMATSDHPHVRRWWQEIATADYLIWHIDGSLNGADAPSRVAHPEPLPSPLALRTVVEERTPPPSLAQWSAAQSPRQDSSEAAAEPRAIAAAATRAQAAAASTRAAATTPAAPVQPHAPAAAAPPASAPAAPTASTRAAATATAAPVQPHAPAAAAPPASAPAAPTASTRAAATATAAPVQPHAPAAAAPPALAHAAPTISPSGRPADSALQTQLGLARTSGSPFLGRIGAAQDAAPEEEVAGWMPALGFARRRMHDTTVVMREGRVWLPRHAPALKAELLDAAHRATGYARGSVLAATILRDGADWSGLHRDADKWAGSCPKRQLAALSRGSVGSHSSGRGGEAEPHLARGADRIALADFYSPGVTSELPIGSAMRAGVLCSTVSSSATTCRAAHILVIIDPFTRWVDLSAHESASAEAAGLGLNAWSRDHGTPHLLRSDGGPHFKANALHAWCARAGIAFQLGCPDHPAGQGLVERRMRELGKLIKLLAVPLTAWLGVLPLIACIMNDSPCRGLGGVSAFEARFGHARRSDLAAALATMPPAEEWSTDEHIASLRARQLLTHLASATAQLENKRAADAVRRPVSFNVGDFVLGRTNPAKGALKLDPAAALYVVAERVGATEYLVHRPLTPAEARRMPVERLTLYDSSRTALEDDAVSRLAEGTRVIARIKSHERAPDGSLTFTVGFPDGTTQPLWTSAELRRLDVYKDYARAHGLLSAK